ncbi:hypothetical protein PHYPSEUDO_008438 [Phytophthora pseudosyringae]|uniref:Uncharacterized protein n=1 Tax=Phytophthora pseudosyringae TaxID=221518 RepID=A0A8T1VHI0_9STRA|nr:hypothetical protein PHYPSEUDO_008438 [Phytophthora pseudosyringae]
MPVRDFEAMCSAMVLTQTTEKLALELEINGSDLIKNVNTGGSGLRLGGLTAADVRAFNSVLTSDHPEEEVLGTRPGKVASRDATLQTGAPIRWHFDDEDHYVHDSHTLTYDFPVPFVRTFSDDGRSEWVNILVPGLGRCQAQRSNLVFKDPVEVEDNPAGLISLTLHFMADEMASLNESILPLLFETIGPSLKSLTLNGPQGTIRQALDDNAIIRCCPNLLKLTLKRAFIHVQLDFTEYRANDTPIPELTFAWLDVAAFAKDLSDPSNPLARFAQRLRVSLNAFVVPPIEEEDDGEWDFPLHVNALVRMLEVNQRLEYFEVKSPRFNCLEDIMKFHRKPIYRQHKSLPIKCKTAFLSVVTSQRTVELKKRKAAEAHYVPVIPALDEHVTANIFSFAAFPVLRRAHYDSKKAIHFHHHH